MTATLRARDGGATTLPVELWSAPATPHERAMLTRLRGPVLDVGCGPGRLTVALAELGVAALGVDASPHAVDQTLQRGASALCRSVFEALPGEGRWQSVLLFDGNIGIGGDPVRLLKRIAQLLAPDGVALVEVESPLGASRVGEVRLETGEHIGPWFAWAWVAAPDLEKLSTEAGLVLTGWECTGDRWLARLQRART